MKKKFRYFSALLIIFNVLILANFQICSAEEIPKYKLGEVIVTATRVEEYVAEAGSSATVITGEEIRKRGLATVKEALRQSIGLDMASNAPFGGPTSVFIRGANSGHTLVMIDGVKVYDPIVCSADFDFAHLTTDNIERIEIIRGPQSPLYGSAAIGGVINIITKKGEGKPKFSASFEGGSQSTFREVISSLGSIDRLNYSFSASRSDSNGISKAAKRDGNHEKDGYENTSFSGKLDYYLTDDITLGFLSRYTRAKFDIDDGAGAGNDDQNRINRVEQVVLSGYFDQEIFDWWKQNLKISWIRNIRHDDDNDDGTTADYLRSWFKGENRAVDWQHTFRPVDWDSIITGFQYNKEEGKSYYYSIGAWGPYEDIFTKKTTSNKGYYAENKLSLLDRHFFNTLALRIDDHSKFGSHDTYKITAAYLFDSGTKLKESFGTGFKAPSLYQLYSSYGDENLNPEKSKGYDLGVEQSLWEDKVLGSITFFKNDFKNLIDYDLLTSKYMNVAKAQTKGIETELKVIPGQGLTLRLTYTYLDADDKTNHEPLIRRARNKYNLNINYVFLKKGNLNLNIARTLKRYDKTGWPSTLVRLKDYTKVDLAASYDITKNFQIFGRAENLFDEFYEDVRGYGTDGISVYAGVKKTF